MAVARARAEYLVGLIGRYAEKGSSILEVGSREGDNLASLWDAGFTDLLGMESNSEKAQASRERHPGASNGVKVIEGCIKETLLNQRDAAFDVVFTVGFLFDKTGDYGWLFPELARITGRYLIAIEDESSGSPAAGLERLGMSQVESADLSRKEGLDSVFTMRVFERSS